MLEIPLRTLARWRQWWRSEFMHTPLWQAMGAHFLPPVAAERLPGGSTLIADGSGVREIAPDGTERWLHKAGTFTRAARY